MKVGRKNKLLQKTLLVMLTTLILFNFIVPTVVRADEDDVNDGGSLANPIRSFLVWIGDSVMGLMQNIFYGSDDVVDKELTDEIVSKWGGLVTYYKYVYIPKYMISPESIFANKIPAFDINFFNPGQDVTNTFDNEKLQTIKDYLAEFKPTDGGGYTWDPLRISELTGEVLEILESLDGIDDELNDCIWEIRNNTKSGRINYVELVEELEKAISIIENKNILGTTQATRESSAKILQSTVSYWYNTLRNISIIGLLSVLVYIGIRIVLSSTAADKSKYKEMLKDWVVAMCLLFFMHYFMSFTVTITESITSSLIISGEEQTHTQKDTGIEYTGDRLIGDIRIRAQMGDIGGQMSFVILYLVIVIYTVVFAIMYLKRVIYMAFFTMIAPLVALTYPIDKIRDGKAQAFDMWMKEYTFNALIQPFHLIIYYIIVGSAMDLAVENPLYALVAIGFMMPAEKILRKFFGFNKSETSGVLGGALGGAMLMSGINALRRKSAGSTAKKPSDKNSGREDSGNKPIRTSDSGNNIDSLMDGLKDGDETSGTEKNKPINSNYNQDELMTDEGQENNRLLELSEDEQNRMLVLEDYLNEPESELQGQYADRLAEYNELKNKERMLQEQDTEILEGENTDIGIETGNEDIVEDNNTSITIEEPEEKPHYFRGALRTAGGYALKGAAGGAKLIAKGAGAVTLGTIGVAAGLASDDYTNVFKYGAAGLAAGSIATGAAVDKIRSLPSSAYRKVEKTVRNVSETYERNTYSPEEIKRRRNARADEAFMRDKQTIQRYMDEYGKAEYEQYMEMAKEYRRYGITDDELIIKAMNLKDEKRLGNKVDRRRIAAAKLAQQVNGMKDISAVEERLKERGISDEKAKAQIDAIRKLKGYS